MSAAAALTRIDPLIFHFPTPFHTEDEASEPISLLEQAMKQLSAQIRRKPEWRTKRLNDTIVSKWRDEAAAANPLLTPDAIDYVMQELEFYSNQLDPETGVEISTVDGVYQSDSLLSKPLIDQFNKAIESTFGQQTDDEKDWHPGSARQVWDIVHPSLYCAVANRTHVVNNRVLLRDALAQQGTGEPISSGEFKSRLFQAIGPYVTPKSRWDRKSDDEEDDENSRYEEAVRESRLRIDTIAAYEEGKIELHVQLLVDNDVHNKKHRQNQITVLIHPEARLIELRNEIARQWTENVKGVFKLYRDDTKTTEFDEADSNKTLLELDIHTFDRRLLAVMDDEASSHQSKGRKVRITVRDRRGVLLSYHDVDENDQILALQEQLCKGEGVKVFWPTAVKGVQPCDQLLTLKLHFQTRKALNSSRRFAEYGMRSHKTPKAYEIEFSRATPSEERKADDPVIEVSVQPLSSEQEHILVDITPTLTVSLLKYQLMNALPTVMDLRHDQISFHYPIDSASSLDDQTLLSSLGLRGGETIGVRRKSDEKEHAAGSTKQTTSGDIVDDPVTSDGLAAHTNGTTEDTQLECGEGVSTDCLVDHLSRNAEDDIPSDAVSDADSNAALDVEEDSSDSDACYEYPPYRPSRDGMVNLSIRMGSKDNVLALQISPLLTVAELKDRIRLGTISQDVLPPKRISEEKTTEMPCNNQLQIGQDIPVSRQQIVLNLRDEKKLLRDHRTLEFYGLHSNWHGRYLSWSSLNENHRANQRHLIEILLKEVIAHDTNAPDDLGQHPQNELEAYDVDLHSTIGDFKRHVYSSGSYALEQVRLRRSLHDPVLADDCTFEGAQITDGSTIVADIASYEVDVLLLTSGSDQIVSFTLYGDRSTTFSMLKDMVAAHQNGCPTNLQSMTVMFGGLPCTPSTPVLVDDTRTFGSYDVALKGSHSLRVLVTKLSTPTTSENSVNQLHLISLRVHIHATNDICILTVRHDAPLYSIMWHLASRDVGQVDDFRIARHRYGPLIPQTEHLSSLSSLNIVDGDELYVQNSEVRFELSLPEDMYSVVHWVDYRFESSNQCIVHAQLDDTIASIKQTIQRLTGVSAELQHLRFAVREIIDDHRTLASYGFTKRYLDNDKSRTPPREDEDRSQALELFVLKQPAPQPPSGEKGRAQLALFRCRILAISGAVYEFYAPKTEKIISFKSYIFDVFSREFKKLKKDHYWDDRSIDFAVNGHKIDDEKSMNHCFLLCLRHKSPLDILINSVVYEEPESGEDDSDENADDDASDIEPDQIQVTAEADLEDAAEAAPPGKGVKISVHMHTLALEDSADWYCSICARFDEVTKHWSCRRCDFDICSRCYAGATSDTAADGTVSDDEDETQPSGVQATDGSYARSIDPKWANDQYTSSKYAWLPSEFQISAAGEASIQSYVNNLHPVVHQPIYSLIEQIFTCFVPMFERVLTELRHPRGIRVPVGAWYDQDELDEYDEDEDDEDDEDDENKRPVHQPDVFPFSPPAPPSTTVSLRGRTVQVITKIAKIVLTPSSPTYDGGVWHVEGMRNESIVASGIAYYDQDNIGPSKLSFRTDVIEPSYEQNDDRGVRVIYGLENEEALVQPLGHVDTNNGRCIAFPNVFQHCVAPFSLIDPTRSGHRSILVFFLVDPTITVLSTAYVPPQQLDWYTPAVNASLLEAMDGARVLQSMVESLIDWPMSMKEAKRHREKLMAERKFFVRDFNEMFERPFSLCEH